MIVSPFHSIVYQVFPACGRDKSPSRSGKPGYESDAKPPFGSAQDKPHSTMGGDCDYKFVALRLNKSSASTIKVTTTYIQSRSSAKAKTENATRATGVAMRIRIPN
jgi:hypothetical protein